MKRIVALSLAAVAAVILLPGCSLLGQSPASTTPATQPASAPPTNQPAPPTTPTDTPTDATTTPPPAATGCAPTAATMVAGAVRRKVGDLDGDGKADTEWISTTPSLRFGVTTASGATFSYALPTASPQAREGFVTRLNDHRIVSIADDGRAAYVHFLVNCAWVTPKDSHGAEYTFDLENLTGHGTGVGCSKGFVVGYEAKNTSTGYTVTQTELYLNATGSVASNGPTTTVVKNGSSSDPRVKTAMTISCASVTVANGGVRTAG